MTKEEFFEKYPRLCCPVCSDVRNYVVQKDSFVCVNGHWRKFAQV